MTETDLDALEYLEADGPLTQREMGDRLLLTSGAITMLVDRLEQAGWVRRRPHPADRRATLIELTAQAVDGAPPGLRNFHTRLEQAAASVEPAHRQALTEFLRGVAQATNQAADELRGQR
jgi:DNA-binding MarR family transcriptional regulator